MKKILMITALVVAAAYIVIRREEARATADAQAWARATD